MNKRSFLKTLLSIPFIGVSTAKGEIPNDDKTKPDLIKQPLWGKPIECGIIDEAPYNSLGHTDVDNKYADEGFYTGKFQLIMSKKNSDRTYELLQIARNLKHKKTLIVCSRYDTHDLVSKFKRMNPNIKIYYSTQMSPYPESIDGYEAVIMTDELDELLELHKAKCSILAGTYDTPLDMIQGLQASGADVYLAVAYNDRNLPNIIFNADSTKYIEQDGNGEFKCYTVPKSPKYVCSQLQT